MGPACVAPRDSYFKSEVWDKVVSQNCITCHKAGGDAEETQFVLLDLERTQGVEREHALKINEQVLAKIARMKHGEDVRVLRKVVGGLDHGGGEVLEQGSAGYQIIAAFVRRVNSPNDLEAMIASVDNTPRPPFFDGVTMLSDRALLRRATLSLASRLPTDKELAAVDRDGRAALPTIFDALMREDAFYLRLREAFEDIFLTRGYDDVPENALSYSHFNKTRHWYQKHDLNHIADEKERQRARYKLTGDYREAMLGEPVKLVEYIVRNDRPITELVTADYIMVTPYTARGYGLYEEIRDRFANPDDPFEYIPVRLPALVGRNPADNQESATGFYPHAGILSTFQYLKRYPTTETNRNRLRTRMYYEHFLGIDLLELAARVSDAAAVTEKFEIPTMQASECAVCHRTMDPVAGLFQDYYDLNGVYGRRKEGWYEDMFGPGFEGEDLPGDQRWRALPWLGERTARDPRFAKTMVGHAYYVLTGRKPLQPPKDLDDPLFAAHRRAYVEQQRMLDSVTAAMVAADFNFKVAFRELMLTDFYRANGLSQPAEDPVRQAELADIGLVHMLSPEQLERKIAAIFGEPWGRLDDQLAMLYGGIDSKEVTERATDPSGAMGAIQRTLANDLAARHTLGDFAKLASERRLFPQIEPDVLPAVSREKDRAIREAIVHLHQLILGRDEAIDSPETTRTFELFAGIVHDAAERGGLEKSEIYHARRHVENAPADPHYTIRAWRGVITYLLRRHEFLYE
jgi:hypothetical protein